MKEKQQSKKEIATETNSLPFDEDEKKNELEQYLSKFELQGKDDEVVTKFVWLIENFD